MPYSQKTKYGSFYDLPSANGDSICVQHCIKAVNSTSPNVRMTLVVPEGFLFRKDLTRVREYLLRNCRLQSIISLPQGVFLPYTGVKTDILYTVNLNQRQSARDGAEHFWYFDVKNDGYTLNNQRRKIDWPSDLTRYEEYRRLDDGQAEEMKLAVFEMIPFKRMRENDYILAGNRYRHAAFTSARNNVIRLGDVANLIRGISFPKSAQKLNNDGEALGIVTTRAAQAEGIDTEKIIYIDASYSKHEKLILHGDILISLANSLLLVGRVTYVDRQYDNLSFGAFMGVICADTANFIPAYLFYILQSEKAKKYFRGVARTTTNISNLTFEDLSNFNFPLPPLEVLVSELEGFQNMLTEAKRTIIAYTQKNRVNSGCVMDGKLIAMCCIKHCNEETANGLKNRIGFGAKDLTIIRVNARACSSRMDFLPH